jgi:hypothetical protein
MPTALRGHAKNAGASMATPSSGHGTRWFIYSAAFNRTHFDAGCSGSPDLDRGNTALDHTPPKFRFDNSIRAEYEPNVQCYVFA